VLSKENIDLSIFRGAGRCQFLKLSYKIFAAEDFWPK
jgi:hypothetical protein